MAAVSLVSRISVVYLYVADLERSVAFYRDLLGIPLEGEGDWLEATFVDGVRFALHRAHEGVETGSGGVRVDFEVADVDEAARRLQEAGVPIERMMREEWGSVCEVRDPDDYLVELYQPLV
jgi:lactoylglutathione lyase